MWSLGVVIDPPVFDDLSGFGEIAEDMLIQTLISQSAIDGEDGPAPEMGPYTGPTLQKEHFHEPSHRGP